MHRTTAATTLAIVALATTLSACTAVPARFKGTPVTEERTVTSFDAVEVRGVGEITIVADEEYFLSVRADESILDNIRTSVVGTTLVISQDHVASSRRIEIVVHAPTISSVELLGAGSVTATGFANDRLAVAIAGAGDIKASGETKDFIAVISGVGSIDASGLDALDVTAQLSGVGSIAVAASRSLDAELSGAGEIKYSGDPSVTSKISGVGQIGRA